MDPLLEQGSFQCKACSKSFPTFGVLEKHGVELHGDEETMRCHFGCETLFKRRMTVIFHLREVFTYDVKKVCGFLTSRPLFWLKQFDN